MIHWIRKHLELLFWVVSLAALFCLPENKVANSLCLSGLLGFGRCPGCGIGHAIHYALHLNFATSFRYHLLGIFGVMVIFIRIIHLVYPVNNAYEA